LKSIVNQVLNGPQFSLKRMIIALALVVSSTSFAGNKFNYHGALLVPQFHATDADVVTQAKPLLYYGGPVLSQVKVMTVLWNDQVSADVKTGISDFYAAYVDSQHMDWLAEYSTNLTAVDGRQGTGQTIGRGSFIGEKILTPSFAGKKISDEQIQAELIKQIDAGILPKPDSQTLYMIHFPAKMQIVIEGMTSCFSFGGYHNGVKTTQYGDLFYGVMPECSMFGGANFGEITYVSAHELIEAVTDPYPTPGSSPAYPQAWNAADGNEIADLCNGGSATLKGPKANYKITLEWSNSRNRCYDGQ